MALVPRAALAQDIDAKIKRLEKMEARIDAKLKKLEAMEARLEVRLQPVAAQSRAGVEPSQDGLKHPSVTLRRATARPSGPAHDEKGLFGGQVSFKGGYSHMDSNTGNVLSAGGGQDGFLAGGALGIPFLKGPWFNNTLLGQISVDFSGFNAKTSGAVGGHTLAETSFLKIAISPKYRIESLGNIRPWIIPMGLAFAANSPPSDGVTYLTVGGTTGAGIEYVLPVFKRHFSLGMQFSYNFFNQGRNQFNSNHSR